MSSGVIWGHRQPQIYDKQLDTPPSLWVFRVLCVCVCVRQCLSLLCICDPMLFPRLSTTAASPTFSSRAWTGRPREEEAAVVSLAGGANWLPSSDNFSLSLQSERLSTREAWRCAQPSQHIPGTFPSNPTVMFQLVFHSLLRHTWSLQPLYSQLTLFSLLVFLGL